MAKKTLTEIIGIPAMLEQTAEEATELCFACLKLARMIRNENAVHGRTREDLLDSLCEEAADVWVCLEELEQAGLIDGDHCAAIQKFKESRWRRRVMEED